jgi:hypothetical protein
VSDSNAEFDALLERQAGISFAHSTLHVNGAAHRVDHARELEQQTVSHRCTPAVLGDLRIYEFANVSFQCGQGAAVVAAHEAGIARVIG